MSEVKVWTVKTVIPTYEIGEAEKAPIFLDKRVYQGSSGKVYPYPTVERISDEKVDKEYTAVYLENEYLKVMVLPQLGGRIQRAYDKTNGYDFVYYNRVIKPALVGLTGPWISGGIEFNWPQHHRPTTFLPVDFETMEGEDGSCSVLCHDVDQMYGTKCITKITLYPQKAYIEITGQLYNRTSLPQTFLWWANPAVPANDDTQSVFPPDVHAVMDHGKRDVSRFPIATGVYYKKDYSEGVDISRYKNIPVPTSYMAEKSKYDFVGGYDYGKEAGILHVADHHISPGKKQWTWGNGDFGRAWDRNLTDEDGPYVELMTGVYTDNQPDFTWLKPFEEKTFRQYFMPYKAAGQVKNATVDAAVNLSYDGEEALVIVYATGIHEKARVVLRAGEQTVFMEEVRISPTDIYRRTVRVPGKEQEELQVSVYAGGRCLVEYRPEPYEMPKIPEPAKAVKEPEEIRTCEELYLAGQHIEQYRHATYQPDPYYLEGLKRDPGDIRLNNAYGQLLMRRGKSADGERYFRKALERLTERNPNPYNSESYYLLGLSLWRQDKKASAYDAFYKAAWSNEQQEMSCYYLAAIDAERGDFKQAYAHAEKALVKNGHNVKARGLKAYLLRKLGRKEEALEWIGENLKLDPFDFVSGNEKVILSGDSGLRRELDEKMRGFPENYLMTARDYAEAGAYQEASALLEGCGKEYPLLYYYRAYYLKRMMDREARGKAGSCRPGDNVSGAMERGVRKEAEESFGGCLPEDGVSGTMERGVRMEAEESFGGCLPEDGVSGTMERGADTDVQESSAQAVSKEVSRLLRFGEECTPDYCFPNKPEDIAVLRFAVEEGCVARAGYYLGCLYYDKQQWQEALALWEASAQADPAFPMVHRNLALAYYNKKKDPLAARVSLEKAFTLNTGDVRIFLELDQLYKKLGWTFEQRLENYEAHRELISRRDDLYIEYITLVNMCGNHEKAYECIMGHKFHPWEGGEGKITAQYTLALTEMARKAQAEGRFPEAEEMLRKAFVYPENLGEGKLEGTKDNHIYYDLGLALEAQGRKEEAAECFQKATLGTDEPAGAMYYNDQPADMILYQGLAHRKLGRIREANSRFYRLLDYGERHLEDQVKIEYFAVSLPDFLIFDEDYTAKNRAHCYYLMALGNIGLGDTEKAKGFLEKALAVEPSHMMCRVYRRHLGQL